MFMMKTHRVDICDLEISSRWPIYNAKQAVHKGYWQTKLGYPSSFPSRVIAVASCLWWIHKVNLSDCERGSRWPTYNSKQLSHERHLYTKLGDLRSVCSQYSERIANYSKFTQNWPLWPWKWVKVTDVQFQAAFPWQVPTLQIWWSQFNLFPT